MLNSGIILKTFTHAYIWQSFYSAHIGHQGRIRKKNANYIMEDNSYITAEINRNAYGEIWYQLVKINR